MYIGHTYYGLPLPADWMRLPAPVVEGYLAVRTAVAEAKALEDKKREAAKSAAEMAYKPHGLKPPEQLKF